MIVRQMREIIGKTSRRFFVCLQGPRTKGPGLKGRSSCCGLLQEPERLLLSPPALRRLKAICGA